MIGLLLEHKLPDLLQHPREITGLLTSNKFDKWDREQDVIK